MNSDFRHTERLTKRLFLGAPALAVLLATPLHAAPQRPPITPRENLVLANEILAMEGLIGPFGHVSVRLGPTRFLMMSHEGTGLSVEISDLAEFDTSITPQDVRDGRLYSEIFIHSAAYKEHPDVNAVVHTHSPYAIALGTLKMPHDRVLPTTNPGSNIGNFIPIFSVVGLIETPDQGQKVARSLQGQNGVLLRGHGAVVVGASLEQAVLRAIYLEFEARVQLVSRAAGTPRFYQPEESNRFKATQAIAHPWEYYVQKVRRHVKGDN